MKTLVIFALFKGQEDKYYVNWYNNSNNDGQCGASYFGIVPKYGNILSTSCYDKVNKELSSLVCNLSNRTSIVIRIKS